MVADQKTLAQLMAHLQEEYNSLEKYKFQVEMTSNPLVKEQLEKLLKMEEKHIQLLEKVLGLHMEVHVEVEKPSDQEGKSVYEWLAQDYEDERQAYHRYKRQSESEDKEIKQILERLAQDELTHMDMLKEIYRILP